MWSVIKKKKPFKLAVLAILQLVGLGLFCKGFFPYKIQIAGHATAESAPPWPDNSQSHHLVEPEFDRLVFVVIDALRNDFILDKDSGFKFVNSLVESKAAIPFTARATAPTVTLPRIKALTTGTVPSFLDAILNIAESDTSTSLEYQDNWVYQLKHYCNNTIHFFGDDTWIRLFPGLFTKQDGTTSFYVSDTVQVDLNVTRHIQTDLMVPDWDTVILHYLGLDHVGHLGGPKSPLMKPKQEEMDHAIEQIYQLVAKQDSERILEHSDAKGTLIVVCGDHGMNEAGNHGGSSLEETSAALVFMSPRLESRPILKKDSPRAIERPMMFGFPVIDQIDLVPTLASVLGFPIPKNSLGKVIVDLYRNRDFSVLRALQLNAYQLGQLLAKNLDESFAGSIDNSKHNQGYYRAVALHELAIKDKDEQSIEAAKMAYTEFIEYTQSYLVDTSSDYGLGFMLAGLGLIVVSTILLGALSLTPENPKCCPEHKSWLHTKLFVMVAIVGYIASMFASSFVEEEHLIWYYFLQTIFVMLGLQSFTTIGKTFREQLLLGFLSISQLPFLRLAVAWNHITSLICSSLKWHLLAVSLAIPVILVFKTLLSVGQGRFIDFSASAGIIQTMCKIVLLVLNGFTAMLVMAYKIRAEEVSNIPRIYRDVLELGVVQQLNQVELGKLIYNYGGATLLMLNAVIYVSKRASLLNVGSPNDKPMGSFLHILLYTSTPILLLISRSQNAFLFSVYAIQFYLLEQWQKLSVPVPPWLLGALVTLFSQTAFFCTGHSNSIASIDLSSSYIGVDGYDTVLIGLLTFCSNWAGSLWWILAGWVLVTEAASLEKDAEPRWWDYSVTLSAVSGSFLVALSVSVTLLREHLFIWTVFSPKYLYQVAWTCLFHWFAHILIGSVVVRIWFPWSQDQHSEDVDEPTDDYEPDYEPDYEHENVGGTENEDIGESVCDSE
ncbi:alkaline-phosphatase-like protein [Phycomyces nitens]|nr:alkaline-phosphatase-like protein [Phycomyces nitens]